MQQAQRKRSKKRKKMPRWKRIVIVLIIIVILFFGGIVGACVYLWNHGYLPTREEFPEWKERITMNFWWQKRESTLPRAEVIGIDVSHYQYRIDWDELAFHHDTKRKLYPNATPDTKQRKVDFVIVKATEGKSHCDGMYKRNKNGAREQHIIFGAYHFFVPNVPADLQAQNYIRHAQLQKGDLAPVLDVERSGISKSEMLRWLNIVEKYYGVRPIIYTYEHYYNTVFHGDERFRKYPFWLARYEGAEPTHHHIIWQFSEKGTVGGIRPCTDLNIFRGTRAEFLLYCIP